MVGEISKEGKDVRGNKVRENENIGWRFQGK